MKIGESSDDDLGVAAVGMVGKEDATDLIVVPWDAGWWFYTIGAIGVKYVVKS